MAALTIEFGYFPYPLDLRAGDISTSTLLDLTAKVTDVSAYTTIHKGWLYAPPQLHKDFFTGKTYQLPYASRIFGLPKTHVLIHKNAHGPEHLAFLVWCLGFFAGMRLTTTQAGFLDATPIEPGTLTDFVLARRDGASAIALAESFWQQHHAQGRRTKLVEGIVHALFLSQYPQYLEFEEFIYLYTALDGCFALAKDTVGPPFPRTHAERIDWMCQHFAIQTPGWAQPAAWKTEVSVARNETLHEALFFEQPLGFALYGGPNASGNVVLEMQALTCRLLVALLGKPGCSYVKTPINTGQMMSLDL